MKEQAYKRDIEESEEVLDSPEGDPINFWERKQRELLTSVVDYNLSTLSDLIETGAIDLSPSYQRRNRWDENRQSKLIESFLMNVPVPNIFLNEDKYGQYSVIDGKQRLLTISRFMSGQLRLKNLEVFSDINGLTFYDFPKDLQTVIKTRPTLRSIIILRQSDEDVKFEVFLRLNSGGVLVNPQEIRNSAFPGPLNNVILELSENKKFHSLLGIKNKEKSAIYQEMRDAELVLRYFTFKDNWQNFTGGVKRQLDRFMAINARMPEGKLQLAKDDFLQTLDAVEACFGDNAFRRWLPDRKIWKQQVLAALYDAEMFASRGFSIEKAQSKREEILSGLKLLFDDREFFRSIDSSTNAPGYFRTRIVKVREMLHQILGE
ncbi:MAG TPA: DUF262 domain-containing protein [Ktedonobacteraceae bacterium]|nr:DUF262 domain-containing protein [Ktedonobacteraceae bacterium]